MPSYRARVRARIGGSAATAPALAKYRRGCPGTHRRLRCRPRLVVDRANGAGEAERVETPAGGRAAAAACRCGRAGAAGWSFAGRGRRSPRGTPTARGSTARVLRLRAQPGFQLCRVDPDGRTESSELDGRESAVRDQPAHGLGRDAQRLGRLSDRQEPVRTVVHLGPLSATARDPPGAQEQEAALNPRRGR